MAFKGKSTIELRNAETGELEQRVEDENMVTNAAYNLVNAKYNTRTNSHSNMKNLNYQYRLNPLLQNCFSGLLLFQNTNTEDVNNIFPSYKNPIIGYASDNYNGKDKMRGMLNANESKAINDGRGYRFVWDFATDKGNGTIRSVSLTSQQGGSIGTIATNETDRNTRGFKMCLIDENCDLTLQRKGGALNNTTYGFVDRIKSYGTLPLVNAQKAIFFMGALSPNTLLYAQCDFGSSKVIFLKRTFTNIIGLNSLSDYQTVAKEVRLSDGNIFNSPNHFTLKEDKIYSFAPISETSACVVIIDVNTLDIISQEVVQFQDTRLIPIRHAVYGVSSTYHDGYFYCVSKEPYKCYKINAKDYLDFTAIDVPFNSYPSSYSYYTAFSTINDILYAYDGRDGKTYVLNDKLEFLNDTSIITGSSGFDISSKVFSSKYLEAPFVFYSRFEEGSTFMTTVVIDVFTPFLSTINNLSTPVVKNETQTMKVTYEITEV